MRNRNSFWFCCFMKRGGQVPWLAGLIFASLLFVVPAIAVDFDLGKIEGKIDTTLAYAVGVRTGDPVDRSDLDNITMRDWTFDKGDITSNSFKITPEVELKLGNYGFFGRATGYWDTVIDQGNSDRGDYPFDQGDGNGWAKEAEDEIGLGATLYDAYVYGSFEVENFLGMGYAPIDIRLGNQAFNWGEGSFYFGGINATNAFDLNKLSLPGSEIKEATVAVPAALVQVGLFDALSVDVYYQFGWSESKYPPVGTFYSDSSDIFGQGGKFVMVDDGFGNGMQVVERMSDKDAKDSGQFGISTRYAVGDVELGLYFIRAHETLPLLQYIVPDTGDVFAYLDENAFRFIYPEKTDMYGASLATTLLNWAVAAEVAYRPNAPISTINPNVYLGTQLGNLFATFDPQSSFEAGRLGTVNPGDVIDAYEERKSWHAQMNFMRQFGQGMGFDTTWAFLTMAADILPGNLEGLASWGPDEQSPDNLAWGYSVDIDPTWYNVMPGLTITPGISWAHNVKGYSHMNGNFWEGRKSIQLRVVADYGDKLSCNLNYNQVFNDEDTYAEDGSSINFSISYRL